MVLLRVKIRMVKVPSGTTHAAKKLPQLSLPLVWKLIKSVWLGVNGGPKCLYDADAPVTEDLCTWNTHTGGEICVYNVREMMFLNTTLLDYLETELWWGKLYGVCVPLGVSFSHKISKKILNYTPFWGSHSFILDPPWKLVIWDMVPENEQQYTQNTNRVKGLIDKRLDTLISISISYIVW